MRCRIVKRAAIKDYAKAMFICVPMCVSVCGWSGRRNKREREKERERESERERERERWPTATFLLQRLGQKAKLSMLTERDNVFRNIELMQEKRELKAKFNNLNKTLHSVRIQIESK